MSTQRHSVEFRDEAVRRHGKHSIATREILASIASDAGESDETVDRVLRVLCEDSGAAMAEHTIWGASG